MGLSPCLGDEPQYRSVVIPAKAGIHGVESAPNSTNPMDSGFGYAAPE